MSEVDDQSKHEVGRLTEQIHLALADVDLRELSEKTGLPMVTLRDFAFGPIGGKSAIHLEMIKRALGKRSQLGIDTPI